MKNYVQKHVLILFVSFFFLSILLLYFCFPLSAEVSNNPMLVSSGESCFYIETENSGITVRCLYPNEYSFFLPIENDFLSIQYSDGFIYIITARHDENNSLSIDKFGTDGEPLDRLIVNTSPSYDEKTICIASGDLVFLRDPKNNRQILCLDFLGNLIRKIEFPKVVQRIHSNPDGNIIVSASTSVFVISGDSYTEYNISSSPLTPLGFSYYLGINGDIYYYSNGFTKIDSDISALTYCGTASKNYICVADGTKVIAISKSGDDNKQLILDSAVSNIVSCGENLFVLTADGNLRHLKEDDLEPVYKPNNEGSTPPDPELSESTNPQAEYTIDSDVYIIDIDNFVILKVNPKTSVTKFKQNITYTFDDLSITDEKGSKLTAGIISTGFMAKFSSGTNKADFTIVVSGDLNSNGQCNNADKNMLISHLLCESKLSNIQLSAADMNFDGNSNLSDLLILSRKAKQ